MEYDRENKIVVDKSDELIDNSTLVPSPDEEIFVQNLLETGKNLLNVPLFEMKSMLNREWFHYSRLSNFFAEAILDVSGADCALFNAGIFLDEIPKGIFHPMIYIAILPHPINLCIIELSANELKEVLLQSENDEWPYLQLKGLGFRGKIFGKMLHYGFSMDKQRQLLVNGKVADLEASYKLVTLDMFTFGYFYPTFKYAKKYILPQFLRHIIADYGQKKFL